MLISGIVAFCICFGACTQLEQKKQIPPETKAAAADSTNQLAYHCPMDCEIGKTYAKAGTCPVCKMKLEKK